MSITVISLSNPIEEIKEVAINWNDLPKEAQEKIMECEYFMVRNSQSLLFYKGRQCVIDCMITRDPKTGKDIELLNGYTKEGKLFEVLPSYLK